MPCLHPVGQVLILSRADVAGVPLLRLLRSHGLGSPHFLPDRRLEIVLFCQLPLPLSVGDAFSLELSRDRSEG